MTLSAITSELVQIRPQAQINAGQPELSVVRFVITLQNESGLYCPHCHRVMGEFIPVRFRHCTDRASHFYHQKDQGQQSQCVSYRPETEKHLNAKAAISESIKLSRQTAYEQIEVTVDRFRLQGEDASDRKPDILVIYKNGAKEAHEVQVSPISETELAQRTIDLKVNHGCDRVAWYLYGKAYSYLNRKWLTENGIEHYRLTFQRDEDGTYPEWSLASAPEDPKPKQEARDECRSNPHRERAVQAIAAKKSAEFAERQRTKEIAKSEDLDLYRWFLYSFQCPTDPFELKPCQRVLSPNEWIPVVKTEVRQSLMFLEGQEQKPSPRHITGALQSELKILKEMSDVRG